MDTFSTLQNRAEAQRMIFPGSSDVREWSGSPCPDDPDNFWIDDETGERIAAE